MVTTSTGAYKSVTYNEDERLNLIYQILGQKAVSSRNFVQYMTSARQYHGEDQLHMREAHFIVQVGPGEGLTMSEIASAMAVTLGAVSQTASRLEKKGYIVRETDPSNRRQIRATLTEKGVEFYHSHLAYDSAKFAKLDDNFLSQFSTEELKRILDYEKLMVKYLVEDS